MGVLPPWGVIAVAAPLAHGHPTSTCDAGVNYTGKALRSEGSGYYDTVEPPLTASFLQWPLFWWTANISILV